MAKGIAIPESTRNCVKKLYLLGKSQPEIASITGVSVHSVKRICQGVEKPVAETTNCPIPGEILREWDRVTGMFRRRFTWIAK